MLALRLESVGLNATSAESMSLLGGVVHCASSSIHVAGYLYQGLCSCEQANYSFSPMQPDGGPSSGKSGELRESCEPTSVQQFPACLCHDPNSPC